MYAFRNIYQRNKGSTIIALWLFSVFYYVVGGGIRFLLLLFGDSSILSIPGADGAYRTTLKIAIAITFAGVSVIFTENVSPNLYYRFYKAVFYIMIVWMFVTFSAGIFYLVDDTHKLSYILIPEFLFSEAIGWMLMLATAIVAYYLSRYENENYNQENE